ncbi:MAG TPA: glycosyltransferase, partial [Solirubrobacteraceae bacterium]|nr:glycosyltransferase [Solirubrobacteraceae bacterium]
MNESPIEGRRQGNFSNLRRRIYLTYTHFGLRTILFRAVTFPLRFTPLEKRLRLRTHARDQELRRAVIWYREHGRPVDVVIPSYRDAQRVRALVRSIRKTVPKGMARVIVSDDASGPEHVDALGRIKGIDVLVSTEHNSGFAANVNRGLRETDPARRGRAQLRRGGAAQLAGVPAVRGPPLRRHRHRGRAAAVPRR